MRSRECGTIPAVAILLSFSLSVAVAGEPTTKGACPTKADYVAKLNELGEKGRGKSKQRGDYVFRPIRTE